MGETMLSIPIPISQSPQPAAAAEKSRTIKDGLRELEVCRLAMEGWMAARSCHLFPSFRNLKAVVLMESGLTGWLVQNIYLSPVDSLCCCMLMASMTVANTAPVQSSPVQSSTTNQVRCGSVVRFRSYSLRDRLPPTAEPAGTRCQLANR